MPWDLAATASSPGALLLPPPTCLRRLHHGLNGTSVPETAALSNIDRPVARLSIDASASSLARQHTNMAVTAAVVCVQGCTCTDLVSSACKACMTWPAALQGEGGRGVLPTSMRALCFDPMPSGEASGSGRREDTGSGFHGGLEGGNSVAQWRSSNSSDTLPPTAKTSAPIWSPFARSTSSLAPKSHRQKARRRSLAQLQGNGPSVRQRLDVGSGASAPCLSRSLSLGAIMETVEVEETGEESFRGRKRGTAMTVVAEEKSRRRRVKKGSSPPERFINRVKWIIRTQQPYSLRSNEFDHYKYGPWMEPYYIPIPQAPKDPPSGGGSNGGGGGGGGSDRHQCQTCGGSGFVPCWWCKTPDGRLWTWNPFAFGLIDEAFGIIPFRFERVKCPKCIGTAELPCPACAQREAEKAIEAAAAAARRPEWLQRATNALRNPTEKFGFVVFRMFFQNKRGQQMQSSQAGSRSAAMLAAGAMETTAGATKVLARRERLWPVKVMRAIIGPQPT